MSQPTLRVVVHGHVQGVGFRFHVLNEAEKLDVGGWVRNRDDGTVEVFADGDSDRLKSLLTWLRQGPDAARVTGVDVDWDTTEEPTSRHFTILG